MRRAFPLFLVCALASASLVFAEARSGDVVLYNHSPSIPVGFYLRSKDGARTGSIVTIRAREAARQYAASRGFAKDGDRFIKHIAAAAGAFVCTRNDEVILDQRTVLHRARLDSRGRALPRWNGCRALGRNEVFLVGDTSDSFDSRYFGPVRLDQIEGVWKFLF